MVISVPQSHGTRSYPVIHQYKLCNRLGNFPVVRQPIGPTTHWFDSPVVRQPVDIITYIIRMSMFIEHIHIQSIYVFFRDSQNPNNVRDEIIIVSLYFYNMKFILFPILAVQSNCAFLGIY